MNEVNFIFCGVDSAEYGITGNPLAPLLPNRRRNTTEIPGRDGVYDFRNNSYEPLLLPMDCIIKPGSLAAKPDDLSAAALWLMGEGPLILGRDMTKRWANAKIYDQANLRHLNKNAQFQVIFECSPPWREDVSIFTGAIGSSQDYGSQLPFAPTIALTMTEAATYLLLVHLASGRHIRIDCALAVDDVVTVDMSICKVMLNGISIMTALSLDSLFFLIPPGEQTITLATDGVATAVMTYRRAYL